MSVPVWYTNIVARKKRKRNLGDDMNTNTLNATEVKTLLGNKKSDIEDCNYNPTQIICNLDGTFNKQVIYTGQKRMTMALKRKSLNIESKFNLNNLLNTNHELGCLKYRADLIKDEDGTWLIVITPTQRYIELENEMLKTTVESIKNEVQQDKPSPVDDKKRVQEIIRKYESLSNDKVLQSKYADEVNEELIELSERNGDDVYQGWADEVLDSLKEVEL